MDSKSLAHPGTEATTEGLGHVSSVAPKILDLYRNGSWVVASDTVAGRSYEVSLTCEACECADHQHRGGVCKHIVAATLANSKSSPCSCCGRRVLNRFLDEVTDDDALLGFFCGDLLCVHCIKAGYWS
jgi:hypothetical protein